MVSTETAGSTKKYGVSKIIIHANYNRRNVENDIALLRLDTPVNLGSTETPVVPVCLPANNNADFSGITATVAGKMIVHLLFRVARISNRMFY